MAGEMVKCIDINGNASDVPVSELSFRPSVFGIAFDGDRVLLTGQWDGWDFPGGGMRLGESIDAALEREVREETGLTVRRGELLHVAEHFFTHPDGDRHFHTILLYFSCSIMSGELSTAGAESYEKIYLREARWIPVKDVPVLHFYNQVDARGLIERARSARS